MMPSAPSGAELLYQGEIEFCEPGIDQYYAIWGLYGTNEDGYAIQKYYWDALSAQGWRAYRTMATGPRPIFCHADYEFVEVDVNDWTAYPYDPPAPANIVADARKDYEVLYSVSVYHLPSESTWDCVEIGIDW